MVRRGVRSVLLATALACWVCTEPAAAQVAPRVTVGVRPTRVRVGDSFTVTVRVAGVAWPTVLDLDSVPGAVFVDYRDRTSTGLGQGGRVDHVLERDFVMKATRPGRVTPTTALLVLDGDTLHPAVPAVQAVASPLTWQKSAPAKERRAREAVPGAEGQPPTAKGRDADRERAPWGLGPYGRGAVPYGGVPYAGVRYGGSPDDSMPHDSLSRGGLPYEGMPYGGVPYGGVPYAGVPYGGVPYGSTPYGLPYGSFPYGSLPYGAVPSDGVPWAFFPGARGGRGGRNGGSPEADSVGRRGAATLGYGPSGWGLAPLGRDWAATATGDPWWPELVPRLERYPTSKRAPGGLVSLEAGLTPERAYVGQQVTLVATATFLPEALARMTDQPEFFPPTAGSAWSVEIPYAAPAPSAVGGRSGEAHTFMRAFFPVEPGRLVVGGARLAFSMGGAGGAAAEQALVTDPLALDVLPVPRRDAPKGWRGAVGRYRVAAWVQPSSVGWGQAALLTVEVSGAGNVRPLERPDPGPLDGAELRPAGERAVVEVRDGVVGGSKTFTWLVIPVEAGSIRIGPVVFAYFDPWLGSFAQVASDELVLEARPLGQASPAGGAAGGVPSLEPNTASKAPAVAASPGPEAATAELRQRLDEDPSDAAAWLALGKAYARGRPGEGWAQWAWASGRLHVPQDVRLKATLGNEPGWSGWSGDRNGCAVVVGPPAILKTEPAWASPTVGRLAPGSRVHLGERYGRWVRVRAVGDVDGWAESVGVAPLG